MKQDTINRSLSRTAKVSKSGRGTYVKPPRMRHSVFVVKQALRGLAALTAVHLALPAFALPTGEQLVSGNEAACHNRNRVRGTQIWIESIELYRFDSGRLQVRYFIKQT